MTAKIYMIGSGIMKTGGGGGGTGFTPTSIASIRQFAAIDPVPTKTANGNTGNLGGTLDGYAGVPVSDTANGSTLIAFATIAWDGGRIVTGVSDPINGAWTQLDSLTDPNGFITTTAKTYIKQNAAPLKAVAWQGTGSFASDVFTLASTTSGSLHIGDMIQGAGIPAFVMLVSLASGSMNANGSTYNINISTGVGTVPTQALTAANVVLVNFDGFNDYQGAVMLEVAGVPASSLAGHAAQLVHAADTTADSASSGAVACGSTPVMLVGFSYNGAQLVSPYVSTVGAGFTNGGTSLIYDRGQPALRWEYKNVLNPGSAAATFTPSGADWYNVFLVAVKTQ